MAKHTVFGRLFGLSKKRRVRVTILAINMLIFASVVGLIVSGSSASSDQPKLSSLAAGGADSEPANPLDELSSADIAVNVARVTRMPESAAVTNTADSENASLSIASTNDNVVSKPQVVSDSLPSNKDIIKYTVEKGDTVSDVAAKFGVTSQTIKLSNGLDGDSLIVGSEIWISPVNGLVYRVKPGDTPESLARKFHASSEEIIALNDVELTGKLHTGNLIVIPDGRQTAAAGPRFDYSLFGGGNYAPGWCTDYAASRSGAPGGWGNAATWAYYAAHTPGWTVSRIPQVGSIAQTTANHVGIVDDVRIVSGHIEIKYSDMNGLAGFGRVGHSGWVSSTSPFQNYIYRH